MAYATSDDIADRLGRDLDENETRIVEARLEDAEAILMTRIPDLQERISDGKLNLRLVIMAEADAVMRLIRNPDGYVQETDGNYSYTIDSKVASGRLSFLQEEWGYLGYAAPIVLLNPWIYRPGWMEGSYDPSAVNPNHDFEVGQDWTNPGNGGGNNEPHEAIWA